MIRYPFLTLFRFFRVAMLVGILLCSWSVQAQFGGTIVTKIEYRNVPDAMQGYVGILPDHNVVKVKGEKKVMIQSLSGGTQRIYTDAIQKNMDIALELMGQRIHLVMTQEEVTQNEEEKIKPTITYLKGKKKIAKVTCKRALCVFQPADGVADSTEVWYAPKIRVKGQDLFPGLQGYPMAYFMDVSGMRAWFEVKSVSEEFLPDSDFEVPEGFTKMTMDEFRRSMGGM